MSQKTLLLISSSPHTAKGKKALQHAQTLLKDGQTLSLFFYGDGAYTASRLQWQSADVPDVTRAWAVLADTHGLSLPVSVSTAFARGITDTDNAKRHDLTGDNLHPAFSLVGLGDLAMMIDDDTTVIQY